MIKSLFILFAIFSLSCFDNVYANLLQNGVIWGGVDLEGMFGQNSKWRYDIMSQARITYTPNSGEQYLFRPSVYYQANEQWSIWFGYDAIPTVFTGSRSFAFEQRIYPQIEFDSPIGKHVEISLRSRIEFRWQSNQPDMALRFRQRVETAFVNFNKYKIDVDMFDELFIGLKRPDWVSSNPIDQNRVYAGIIIPLTSKSSMDVGYVNIYRPLGSNSSMDHVLQIGFGFKLFTEIPFPIRTI